MKQSTKPQIYFDTMSQAIDEAYKVAREKGFEPVDNMFLWDRVPYGESRKATVELTKDGKPNKKCLHIQFYRMESGRYELNHYIS